MDAAMTFANGVVTAQLDWLEEPLPAYASADAWLALQTAAPMPLAAGENIAGHEAFEDALMQGFLSIVQADVVKWGGLKGCNTVARRVLENGARYCPHFLGGGIGLAASAELLAAVGVTECLRLTSTSTRCARPLRYVIPL